MKNIFLPLAFCGILFTNHLFGQDQGQNASRADFKDKVFFGGGIGAGFGNYTYISVSPIIGYRLTPKLSTGVRLMYQYTTFKYYDFIDKREETYNGNDFGIGGFATYSLFGPIFLQAEYEHLSYDGLYYDGTQDRTSFDSFLAGGGFSQPMGRKAAFFMAVLYNFSFENFDSTNAYRVPYSSPWVVRIGISGGF